MTAPDGWVSGHNGPGALRQMQNADQVNLRAPCFGSGRLRSLTGRSAIRQEKPVTEAKADILITSGQVMLPGGDPH